jgi:hypothetical protein
MKLEDYIESKENQKTFKKPFIIFLILILLFFSYYYYRQISFVHRVFMSVDKLSPEKVSILSEDTKYSFSLGEDFFVYYKKGWSDPKTITAQVYKLNDEKKELLYTTSRSFKKGSPKIQLYFDDTFFEIPGEYEIEFLNEENESLAKKAFEVRNVSDEK